MYFRTRSSACAVLTAAWLLTAPAAAQTGTTLTGRLTNSLSGDPVTDVTVAIDELRRETQAGADGTFGFDNVPPGDYHLSIRGNGFSARRTEVRMASSAVTVDIQVDPEIHYTEVLSVSPEPRSLVESYQPTTVLAGQELTKQLGSSLGSTLENQPGMASRSFGPTPARPVIRGLDGDRVLILQDSQRMGDLSSQSADHGVTVNPAASQRIEVVRGPATLLYGANAIGGLVNVITEQIPTRPVTAVTGNMTFEAATATREGGGAGEVFWGNGRVALQFGGGGRRTGDVATPEGDVDNSQSRSSFGTVGLSLTGSQGYFGGSYGYDDLKYGTPVVEDGQIQLTPRRHAFGLRGGRQNISGIFDSFRASVAVRRYRHDELEGEVVGTQFKNNTADVDVLASHKAYGRLEGSIGGAVLTRAFDSQGEEALAPAIDQSGFGAFLYEELTWPHFTFQFGARVEQTDFTPTDEPTRDFTNASGSVGLLIRPAGANDAVTIAASLARAARNPALEELFFFGPHIGNFAFEVGNPELSSEQALGFDVSLRWRTTRASGEFTYFRNAIQDFVFRGEITREEFESRIDEYAARFPSREIDAGEPSDLPYIEFTGADSLFQGFEAHTDLQITNAVTTELGVDYVRASLQPSGDPLPRIPPFRFRVGVRYQRSALQVGGDIVAAAAQERTYGVEAPTDGYTTLKLFSSYSFDTGGVLSTITARLDNATNELYRNHLSYIKDFVPETGRSFRLLYNVKF